MNTLFFYEKATNIKPSNIKYIYLYNDSLYTNRYSETTNEYLTFMIILG